MPMAMIPFSDAKRTMFSRFREVRNTFCPLRTGATIADTITMTANPNTLWNRSSVCPARRPRLGPADIVTGTFVSGTATSPPVTPRSRPARVATSRLP